MPESVNDELTLSKFNTGMLKMIRINEAVQNINSLSQNPLDLQINGEFNYKLLFRNCNTIFMECYPQLNEDKRLEGIKLKEIIEQYIDAFPVYARRYEMLKKKNWQEIRKGLFLYERFTRECLKITNMDTPPKAKGMF